MKKLFNQILRFSFVGGTAFLIDFGTMWALTELLSTSYLLSNGISFTVSVIYNYILSTHWVFQTNKTRKKSTEIVVFVVLSLIGLSINQAIMWAGTEKLQIDYRLVKILATGIVMIFNFITRKLFLERKSIPEANNE